MRAFQVPILLLLAHTAHSLPIMKPNAPYLSQSEESQELKTCGKGELFIAPDKCQPCHNGFYMNEDQHRKTKCRPCPHVDEHYEKYLNTSATECTREAPPLIVCIIPNHYYVYPEADSRTGDCKLCTLCEYTKYKYVGRNCSYYSNTVCCPYTDMDVKDTDEGPQCIKRTTPPTSVTETAVTNSTMPRSSLTPPQTATGSSSTTVGQILCGRNEYYVPGNSSCKPCPQGTFQRMTNHKDTKCPRKREQEESTNALKPLEIILIIDVYFIHIMFIVRGIYKCRSCRRVTLTHPAEDVPMLDVVNSTSNHTTVTEINHVRHIAVSGDDDTNSRGGNSVGGGDHTNTEREGVRDDDTNNGG